MDFSILDLPIELLIIILTKYCYIEDHLFIALSCKLFYLILKQNFTLIQTKYKHLFTSLSRKKWALNLIRQQLKPTILHRLYILRNNYGPVVFNFEIDNPNDDDYVLNSHQAFYIITGKLLCNKCKQCITQSDTDEYSSNFTICLYCKTHLCSKCLSACDCNLQKRQTYLQSSSSKSKYSKYRTKTYEWQYNKKSNLIRNNQIIEYKKLYRGINISEIYYPIKIIHRNQKYEVGYDYL